MDEKKLLQTIGGLYLEIVSRDDFIKELKTMLSVKDQELVALRTQLQNLNAAQS